MKKVYLVFSFIFLLTFGAFAGGDIQIGAGLSTGYPITFGISGIVINHNFFAGENKEFGVGERVSVSLTGLSDNTSFVENDILVGFDFKKNFSESVALQVILGPAASFGDRMFSARKYFCLSAGCDAQIKFSADRRCSFVAGVYAQAGALFDKASEESYAPSFHGRIGPYVMFGINW